MLWVKNCIYSCPPACFGINHQACGFPYLMIADGECTIGDIIRFKVPGVLRLIRGCDPTFFQIEAVNDSGDSVIPFILLQSFTKFRGKNFVAVLQIAGCPYNEILRYGN